MTTAPRVRVETGSLVGSWKAADVAAFQGIPFAAPPVGPLRWRAPQAAEAWEGDRSATEFAPAPLQPSPPPNSAMYLTNFDDGRPLITSEDCLYLNVWTPDPSAAARLPVMVWIHGGGNRYGYGSQAIHDGTNLARRGVVVVTLNHRLGALGFLAHPSLAAENGFGASGNYGTLDLIAALGWVQRNIAAFGGDPAKVTVAGNSAGAAHITHLMTSPLATGLFRAAIGQSAAGIYRAEGRMHPHEVAARAGVGYAEQFGGGSADDLRMIDGTELVMKGHFGPIVDGLALPTDPHETFNAGGQLKVPLLVGSNDDEGSVYSRADSAGNLIAVAERIGSDAFSMRYPTDAGEHGSSQAAVSARLFVGESRFTYPIWRWATTHVQTTQSPTWVYRFAQPSALPASVDAPPDGLPGYGVYHTSELLPIWDNLHTRTWAWSDSDRALATTMADTWVRFVTDLNPAPAGRGAWWPRFSAPDGSGPVRVFGGDDDGTVAPADRLDAMRVLDALPRPLQLA